MMSPMYDGYKIEVKEDPENGLFSVYVNDDVLMECLSKEEIKALTLGEIDRQYTMWKG